MSLTTTVGGSERGGGDRSQEIYCGRISVLCVHECAAEDSDLVSEHETREIDVRNETHIRQTHEYLCKCLPIGIRKTRRGVYRPSKTLGGQLWNSMVEDASAP